MSGENIDAEKFFQTSSNNLNISSESRSAFYKVSSRVNINHLILKLREKEKKQKKENWFFFGLVSSVVVVTGIIASL